MVALPRRFRDRIDAGQALADELHQRFAPEDLADAMVLALPRGGVPVAGEIARALDLELDVLVVRKVGVPGHEELAMGAIASGDVVVRNADVIDGLSISEGVFDGALRRARAELEAREERLGKTALPPAIEGRTVIIVDDGVATGATMRAAISALRILDPARIVVALPVAPPTTAVELEDIADLVVCVDRPASFGAVGGAYDDFSQTADDEVRRILQDARDRMSRGGG